MNILEIEIWYCPKCLAWQKVSPIEQVNPRFCDKCGCPIITYKEEVEVANWRYVFHPGSHADLVKESSPGAEEQMLVDHDLPD